MKKTTCAVLIFIMIVFLVNPLSKGTRLLLHNVCVSGYHSYGVQ